MTRRWRKAGACCRSRREGLLVLRVVLALPAALAAGASAAWAQRGCPPRDDLYCMELVATPAFPAATGIARLGWVPTPFGVAVTPEGEHLYDLTLTLDGLPDPRTLGPYFTYVAWATTPVLRPMLKLGDVRNGVARVGRVGFNKFLILVSAEPSAAVRDRSGPLVLRGASPSMRLQPHDLPILLAAAGGHAETQSRGDAAHGRKSSDGWVPPPMHPGVPMLPGLMGFRPQATPFLPDPGAAGVASPAIPHRFIRLNDGDTLRLEAGPVTRTILGRSYLMYGFNGQYPGPVVEVAQRATIVVDFVNRTALPTAVHWHGVRLDNRFDGVPHVTQEPVAPGERFVYHVHFPDAGIYWYHPHHREDIQQDLGLYGNLFVRPTDPDYFAPAHRDEILMLDDLLIGEAGLVPYGLEAATHALNGRFGNVLLVNGEPRYELEVRRGEVIRFFLTNASSTRVFNLSFPDARMKIVGSDLGNYEREEWTENVVIAPAERYIVDVRFESAGRVPLVNRVHALDKVFGNFVALVDTLGLVRVARRPARPDLSAGFDHLRENDDVAAEIARYRVHFDRPPDRELELTVRLGDIPFPIDPLVRMDSLYFHPVEWSGTMPEMNWVTTARQVRWVVRDVATGAENDAIDWRFHVGDLVRLRLRNQRHAGHAMQHPIHIHGQRFLVLSVNGVANPNRVWKDTVLLPVGVTAELLVELSNPGRWMLHCHIAEHLSAGMAMVFEVS
ncbi:MAG: multicopper oxidase family protein [Gemmatimonadetes bacterium]|nr:multicopper oxidase family protein [Gemmatimonadota bacterium]